MFRLCINLKHAKHNGGYKQYKLLKSLLRCMITLFNNMYSHIWSHLFNLHGKFIYNALIMLPVSTRETTPYVFRKHNFLVLLHVFIFQSTTECVKTTSEIHEPLRVRILFYGIN